AHRADAQRSDGGRARLSGVRGDELVRVRRARKDAEGDHRLLEPRAGEGAERSVGEGRSRQARARAAARQRAGARALHRLRNREVGQGRPRGRHQAGMTEAELARLAVRVLEARGIAAGDAEDAARILVTGDLMGHSTHGVLRLESYSERMKSGAMDANARITVEDAAPAIARIDGANALGPLVGVRAVREAMARARQHGVGLALARNSNHFGAIAPYCLIAAREGFASMIGSNASTTIAPTGGAQTRLGNNPLGFGVPRPGGRPVILDMAMSVVARGKIRAALQRGESIPDTWATDRAGKPTTDPKAALDGFLLPFGGYKGYG